MATYYSPTVYHLKRGDTLDLTGTITRTENGVQTSDFTGWTARSHLKTLEGVVVAQPVVEWLNASAGLCRVTVAAVLTQAWPTENLNFDVEFTSSENIVISTPTAILAIEEDITL